MTVVPFELEATYGGLAETSGLLSSTDAHLSLQFQSRDSIVGVVESDVNQIKIPLQEVASLSLKKSWLGLVHELEIQVSNLQAVAALPGMTQGRLVLSIARRDRDAAATFVSEVNGVRRA
jgi:hypothetical protein